MLSTSKAIDLQPKGTLYGHLSPVNIIEVSESFSTLLSASTDGVVLLWDLNRLKFVRELIYSGGSLQVSNMSIFHDCLSRCKMRQINDIANGYSVLE